MGYDLIDEMRRFFDKAERIISDKEQLSDNGQSLNMRSVRDTPVLCDTSDDPGLIVTSDDAEFIPDFNEVRTDLKNHKLSSTGISLSDDWGDLARTNIAGRRIALTAAYAGYLIDEGIDGCKAALQELCEAYVWFTVSGWKQDWISLMAQDDQSDVKNSLKMCLLTGMGEIFLIMAKLDPDHAEHYGTEAGLFFERVVELRSRIFDPIAFDDCYGEWLFEVKGLKEVAERLNPWI